MDCNLPGFSVHGILQARILEWVTISFSRGSSRPRDQTWVSHIGGRYFNLWATRGFSIPTDLVGMTIQRALFRNLFFSWFGLLHALLNVISQFIHPLRGLPWWLSGKEPACQCRRRGFDPTRLPMQETWVRPLGQEDLLEKEMATHSNFWPGKSHGQRSLAG